MRLLPHHYTNIASLVCPMPDSDWAEVIISEMHASEHGPFYHNGNPISYQIDTFGEQMDESRFREVFKVIGDFITEQSGDSEITLSLGNDLICSACAIGDHCNKRELAEQTEVTDDVLLLESFGAWHHLATSIDCERLISEIRLNNTTYPLVSFLKKISDLQSFLSSNFVNILHDSKGMVSHIKAPKSVLFSSKFMLFNYFAPPIYFCALEDLSDINGEEIDVIRNVLAYSHELVTRSI